MPKVEAMYRELSLPARKTIMKAPVDPWTMEQTVDATEWLIEHRVFAHLIGVNADKLLQMRDDPEMDSFVRNCEIINADGASMVMASELLGTAVPERVAGVDLMQRLCALAASKGYRVYLLGAKKEVVVRTAQSLGRDYPGIKIVGYRDGYFTDDEFEDVISEVGKVDPDIVFVGITSPKKERLIERFREMGAKGAYVGVGGTFDVLSGAIPRAPIWMQKARLEWLFRLLQEPNRLFKRYLVGNTRFLLLLGNELKKKRRASDE